MKNNMTAKQMGKQAFEMGLPCVPARHDGMLSMLLSMEPKTAEVARTEFKGGYALARVQQA